MLNFLLFLQINPNKTISNTTLPILSLFFSSSHTINNDIFNAWNNISDQYKDIPEILITKIDCDTNTDLCNKYNIQSLPSIFKINNISTTQINISEISFPLLKMEAENLIYFNKTKCKYFSPENTKIDFPVYVINWDKRLCNYIDNLRIQFPGMRARFYRGQYSKNFSMYVYLNPKTKVRYNGDSNTRFMARFIFEYSFVMFGNWNPIEYLKTIHRNIIFIAYKNESILNDLRDYLFEFESNIAFGKIHIDKLNAEFPYLNLNSDSIGVISRNREKFNIFPYQSPQDFVDLVNKIKFNSYRDFKYNVKQKEMDYELRRSLNYLAFACFVIIITFFAIYVEASKCINYEYKHPYALSSL